jgi:queuosine precursor transporter
MIAAALEERTPMTIGLIAAYLTAIIIANLAVATFGPAITPLTAFLFIGLDLTTRDALHDRWRHRHLPLRMAALIAAGSLASWLINPAAGRIALASAIAFALAATADAGAYHFARRRPWLQRANASNVIGAAVDSLAFPTLAFGALLPWVVAGQFIAKVAGGAVWSLLLARLRPRPEPAHAAAGD